MLPDDDKRYAIETCRSSESVLKKWLKIIDIQLVHLLVVWWLVNLQDARCNNKGNEFMVYVEQPVRLWQWNLNCSYRYLIILQTRWSYLWCSIRQCYVTALLLGKILHHISVSEATTETASERPFITSLRSCLSLSTKLWRCTVAKKLNLLFPSMMWTWIGYLRIGCSGSSL